MLFFIILIIIIIIMAYANNDDFVFLFSIHTFAFLFHIGTRLTQSHRSRLSIFCVVCDFVQLKFFNTNRQRKIDKGMLLSTVLLVLALLANLQSAFS